MRADLDTFPTPGLLGYWPKDLICNRNAATTPFRSPKRMAKIHTKKKFMIISVAKDTLFWVLIQQLHQKSNRSPIEILYDTGLI